MERISVAIRVRPPSKEELVKGNHWVVEEQEKKLSLCNCYGAPLSGYTYAFDQLFGSNSKNSDVYDIHAKEVVISALQGFNGTVFAYGQTSSGKTYTMQGSDSHPGIIPLAIRDVFDSISQNSSREFLVRVSYMEIYNEEINDLLAPENRKLQIHENFEKGLFVAGLREEIVNSPDQVFDFLKLGEAHRHFGETNMNSYSSRSHSIFRMVIESRDNNRNTDSVRVSTLNLVDLAGSERVAKTGAGGVRLKEGQHINKSLMTLGTVINKLSEGPGKGGHIPYRDSKLTRILQSALDGNAKTAIICTITPDEIHIDETKGTLQFASRAKKVATCAHVNEILTDAALLKRQKKEIEELREKLLGLRSDDFEKQLLNLRNDLLKYELEKEKLALELEEERAAQLDRERRIKEQEQKIENLSSLVLSSAARDDYSNAMKMVTRRETWSPQQGILDASAKECFRSPLTRLDSSRISTRRDRGRVVTPLPAFESLLEKNADDLWEVQSTPFPSHSRDEQQTTTKEKPNVADEDAWTRLNQELDDDWATLNTEDQAVPSTSEYTPCVKSDETELMEFQVKELQLQLEELQSRFDSKSEEAADATRKLNVLLDSNSEINRKVEDFRSENNRLRECRTLQEQQLNEIITKNQHLNQTVADLRKENSRLESELEQLNACNLRQKEEMDQLAEENVRIGSRLTTTVTENTVLLEDKGRLDSLLKSAKLEEHETANKLDELERKHSQNKQELDAAVEQKQLLEEKLFAQEEKYKTQLHELMNTNTELQRTNEQLKSSASLREENYNTELQKLSDKNTSHHKIHKELEQSMKLQEEKHKQELKDLSRTNSKLLKANNELKLSLEAEERKAKNELQIQNDRMEQSIARKESQLRELTAKLSALESSSKDEHEALIESLHMSNAHISMLDEDLRQARRERDDLAAKVGVQAQQNQELLVSMKLERLRVAQELGSYLGALSFQQDSLSTICSGISSIVRA
ncbi:kinesin-like protein KIN-7L [Selaginella moellendorffii]|uniref:kinesin-like protein KIN-7L n=1 Tax=Selaginella moellendorffii TaxID=88036 RepID=UPI000D1CC594|nr:kinesin-like protein KIN-7L [Selaginella moellendorffii]|eukprot:XP_024541211.1 kinesin-like protein KIN-7L [Selaginella moellendorffii]